ncbi:MAG TPA: PAS domain S-box protein [Anaerolineales bacterium]|nr:PAS domain S-box protein [Anaerolineales bacterium]
MNPLVSAYVLSMILAAMLCMVIIVYVWPRRRKSSETMPLILLLAGIIEWICAALLGMLDQNLLHKLLWAKIEYIGVLSVPLAVLVFVLHHSGIQPWLSRKRLAWLAVIPALTLLLAWTNDFHRLVWASYTPYLQDGLAFSNKTYGPAFWIYWGYSYLLLLAATVLTVRAMLASARIFRWQSILVAVGILAPWAANLLYILHIDPIRNLDLTPLAFGITSLALAIGMFRWQLFDVKPIAQAAVIAGMKDGLMILDNQGRILDVNPAGQAILGQGVQQLVGKPMEEIVANRLAPDERSRWLEEKGMEIRLAVGGAERDFELSDSPFYQQGGPLEGRIIFMHDVTGRKRLEETLRQAERKQAEQALRLSEDKFKYVFDYSVEGKSFTRLSGGMEVNQAFCDMLGYSREELTNRKWQEITHPEDVELTQQMIDVLLSGEKETVRFTKRFLHKNGSIVWVDIGTALRRDQDGQPLYLMTSVNDITERKQAEEKLRESETRFSSIFDLSPIPISLTDQATERWVEVNEAFLNVSGFTREEMLGHTFQELGLWAHPHKREELRKMLLERGRAQNFEMDIKCKDGAIARMLLDAEQINLNGKPFLLIMGVDITERKKAEELLRETSERLAHMLANSPTVIYALKVAGDQAVPIWISENIETVLGYQVQEAMQSEWWLEQVDPQDRAFVQASLDHLFDDFYQQEYHFLRKDGQTIWLQDEHRLLRNEDNTPREIIGAWTDITERKQAEEALREYNIRLALDVVERTRELQEAQEKLVRQEKLAVLGQLAGGVGHELRNPLAVINNAVYYLKLVQPEADEKVRKYHSVIEHEVNIAEKIITDLLDFARIKSVDREALAVPELARTVLERFPAPESITTVLEFPEDLPHIFVDPRQMEQVLGNLVVNACQAMGNGGQLTIRGQVSAFGDGQPAVSVQVSDTGSGITPENMGKLFEPLFTTKPKGIGLGLAVSRKLVEANGGCVEVQSLPGQGATFTLFLPVQPPETDFVKEGPAA